MSVEQEVGHTAWRESKVQEPALARGFGNIACSGRIVDSVVDVHSVAIELREDLPYGCSGVRACWLQMQEGQTN
jgi:hypothetical protein